MPTIQQLRYLTAVAEHRHFRRAAEACNVTQPTLSAQLRALERRLEAPLIERARGGVILTPVGAQIVEHARRALAEVEEIRGIARAGGGVLSSVVRVGVVQSIGSYVLPLIVPDLHATFPKLGLYVREALQDALLAEVEAGTLDLLILPLPIKRGDLEVLSLYREPIEVVIPHDHRLANERDIDPGMLRGERVMSLGRGHQLYEQVQRICADFGAQVSHDFEGTSLDTIRQMVAMGMGISLMPTLYVKSEVAHQDIVVARPFRGAPPARTVGMVWRKNTARVGDYRLMAQHICATLKRVAPEIAVLG